MGTLVYNNANILNPTISDFESSNIPTAVILSPYIRYFISSDSIAYFGAYNSSGLLWLRYASLAHSYVSYSDKTDSVFGSISTLEIGNLLTDRGIYVSDTQATSTDRELTVVPFDTENDLYQAFEDAIFAPTNFPITYRLTNATTTGPNEANVGDTVTVSLTFPEGYGVVNPSSDVYVSCNGVLVPSTYSDGQLVFTMPDPS